MSKKDNRWAKLKDLDYFQSTIISALEWLRTNTILVTASVGILVAIFGIVFGIQYWKRLQVDHRQSELSAIEYSFAKENAAAEEKKDALRKASAPANKTEPGKPPAKLSDDTQKKLDSELELIKADHSASIPQFHALYQKYPTYPEGWVAASRVIESMIAKKDFAGAKPILESALKASKGYEYHQIQFSYTLANILVEEKQYDQALLCMQDLQKIVPGDLKPQVLLLKSKILIAKGDKEAATQAIEELAKDHASSREAQQAKSLRTVYLQ